MVLELVCGADFWCNRHCRTSPVVLEGFGGQVWPTLGRKPEKSEYRVANEPLSKSQAVWLEAELSPLVPVPICVALLGWAAVAIATGLNKALLGPY